MARTLFTDRRDAGRQLAVRLASEPLQSPVVLGLPRGGVPVAFEVAAAMKAPLDVLIIRKLGVPWQPELAMGAVGEDGARVLDARVIASTGVTDVAISSVEAIERRELARLMALFRGGRPAVPLEQRDVVLVDDGVATGASARVAAVVARQRGASRVVVAVPVGPTGIGEVLRPEVDAVVCLFTPRLFRSVGAHYDDFTPTTDDEAASLLHAALGPIDL